MVTTLRSRWFIALAALAVIATACPATSKPGPTPVPAPAPSFAEPQPFLAHLLALARSGDIDGWSQQLTPQRRARGGDYLRRHFAAWRAELLRLAPAIEGQTAVLLGTEGRMVLALTKPDGSKDRLVRVTRVDGALKIDEN